MGVGVGTGVAVGVGGVVGVGMAAMVAAIRATTVESTSGVGSGVGVEVGSAARVAAIPAATVASMSGGGVGVSVGKAADTAASTVACRSGVEAGSTEPQATDSRSASAAAIASPARPKRVSKKLGARRSQPVMRCESLRWFRTTPHSPCSSAAADSASRRFARLPSAGAVPGKSVAPRAVAPAPNSSHPFPWPTAPICRRRPRAQITFSRGYCPTSLAPSRNVGRMHRHCQPIHHNSRRPCPHRAPLFRSL